MIKRKKNTQEAKETILLVTATKSEALYFNQMRKDCRYMNLTVEWAGREGLSLKQLIDITGKKKYSGKFNHVFALFGFDDVNTNIDEVKAAEEICAKKRITMIYFNPCFELWFLLHLKRMSAFEGDSQKIRDEVKSGINGFEFSPQWLLTKGLNLHLMLFPRHAQADLNARTYNDANSYSLSLPALTMPVFNQCVQDVCGVADMSHNQKAFK